MLMCLWKKGFVFVSLHVPHGDHKIPLEDALGAIYDVIDKVVLRSLKELRMHREQFRIIFWRRLEC